MAKVNTFPLSALALTGCFARDDVRELQVKGGEEMSALRASILDKAFKHEWTE